MKSLLLLTALLFFPHNALPETGFNNHGALQGLVSVKAVFDINQGNPDLLRLRLQLVEESYRKLVESGVEPDFVLTFRGKASFFLTTGIKYVDIIDLSVKQKIHQLLEQLSGHGMVLEQCAIAARLAGIDTDDFLPQIEVVDNGYISLIGYQNKGYAFIPME